MSYSNVKEISEKMKALVDDYWKLGITETEFTKEISIVFSNTDNRGLVMRGYDFKPSFVRVLGKNRIEEIKKALIKIDKDLYGGLLG